MTGSDYQRTYLCRAAEMARLRSRCQCVQGWHRHPPGECTDMPTVFDLPEQLGLDGLSEEDWVERIRQGLFVLCEGCRKRHNPRGTRHRLSDFPHLRSSGSVGRPRYSRLARKHSQDCLVGVRGPHHRLRVRIVAGFAGHQVVPTTPAER